jgi:hypothetical protein
MYSHEKLSEETHLILGGESSRSHDRPTTLPPPAAEGKLMTMRQSSLLVDEGASKAMCHAPTGHPFWCQWMEHQMLAAKENVGKSFNGAAGCLASLTDSRDIDRFESSAVI